MGGQAGSQRAPEGSRAEKKDVRLFPRHKAVQDLLIRKFHGQLQRSVGHQKNVVRSRGDQILPAAGAKVADDRSGDPEAALVRQFPGSSQQLEGHRMDDAGVLLRINPYLTVLLIEIHPIILPMMSLIFTAASR